MVIKKRFLYVTDVAEAFYKATLTSKNSEIWNLGSGNPQSVNKLIKLLKPKNIIHIPKRPGSQISLSLIYLKSKKI